VKDEESLKTGTLISEFPDSVQAEVDYLFSDGVVTPSVVVRCVLLRVEKSLFKWSKSIIN
jgi:hypothetical protein